MKRTPHRTAPALSLVASALLTGTATAATITGVTIEDVSSYRGGFQREAEKAIDGSGFNAIAGTHDAASDTGWQSNKVSGDNDTTPDITFDLGAVYEIDSLSVWNYNDETNAGINAVTITYGETLSLGSTLTEVTSFSQADGTATYAGQTFSSFTPFSARYIKFDATSNYGNGRSGLAEVRFSAVPEPGSIALFGLGGLMIARRRRN